MLPGIKADNDDSNYVLNFIVPVFVRFADRASQYIYLSN